MEEGVLGLCLAGELLYVVDDECVDGLVEADEVVDFVLADGIGVLDGEEVGGEVDDSHVGVELLDAESDGVDEVGLSAA